MYGMCNPGAMRKVAKAFGLGHLAVFSNKLDAAFKVQSIDSDYISHPFRNLSSEMNVNIHELL